MEDASSVETVLEINPNHIAPGEYAAYDQRYTVRAVVRNANGEVALINIRNEGRYKLPGGGIDPEETEVDALLRECREEIGAQLSDIRFIGTVREVKAHARAVQYSRCYTALATVTQRPELEPNESMRGFVVAWLPLDDAINAIAKLEPHNEEGQYVVKRDLGILAMVRDSI